MSSDEIASRMAKWVRGEASRVRAAEPLNLYVEQMSLLPGLQGAVEAMASMAVEPEFASTAERRAWMHARIDETFTSMYAEHPPVASEANHRVTVPGGEITVRVYRPATGTLPCYLYLHGGGFWLGTLEQSDSQCRAIASDADCVVVSVDYRLAPECKFPTAVEDSYAALLWVDQHAPQLGIDPARMAVGGGSAGGNLAAAVCLMTRDRGGPQLIFQVLEIAVLDLTTPDKQGRNELYLADPGDANNPYASPMVATDLAGLPAALVMAAEFDPLSVEDMAYAQRLTDAGIPVEAKLWEGQFHGSQQLAKLIPDEAAAYHHQLVSALRAAYGYP